MSRSRKAKPEGVSAADVVRERVKAIRRARGWSAQELANRLYEVDPTTAFDRDVLANFESGRRPSVSIDEVLLLAFVLDEPPAALYAPYTESVRIGTKVPDTRDFAKWVTGLDHPLDGQDSREFGGRYAGAFIVWEWSDVNNATASDQLDRIRRAAWEVTEALEVLEAIQQEREGK